MSKTSRLPPGVRLINGSFYFYRRTGSGNRESIPLGKDETTMRKKWAELTKFSPSKPGSFGELLDRYMREVLPAKDKKTGRYILAEATRDSYTTSSEVLRKHFGDMPYAKSEVEAATGKFIRAMDIAQFLRNATAPVQANRHIGLMSVVFSRAREWGNTEYNPCTRVRRNKETPRDYEPTAVGLESLLNATNNEMMKLTIRFAAITGWREGDIRLLRKDQLREDGIFLRTSKRGKKQLWVWTPELRTIVDAAKALRNNNVSSLWVFPSRTGTPYTIDGFQSNWARIRNKAGLKGMHFHDIRSFAGDEAEAAGLDSTKFLGHSDPKVTKRHYLRRTTKIVALK
jgi:integrase